MRKTVLAISISAMIAEMVNAAQQRARLEGVSLPCAPKEPQQ